MTGSCPQCSEDPGFDWAVCPSCGYRADGRAPAASAPAARVADSGGDRWDKTIIEPAATPIPRRERERARFAGRGDFYTPVGSNGNSPGRGPAPDVDDRTIMDRGDGFYGGDGLDDRTIIDRGGRGGPEVSDATVIIHGGGRGVSGPLVYFVQRNGIRAGRVYLLQEETEIGRAADCDIVLGDETVSKRHAKVRREDGRFVYWDLASANHSYLLAKDGQKTRIYEPHPLSDGDTIDLGDVRLTYLEVDLGAED